MSISKAKSCKAEIKKLCHKVHCDRAIVISKTNVSPDLKRELIFKSSPCRSDLKELHFEVFLTVAFVFLTVVVAVLSYIVGIDVSFKTIVGNFNHVCSYVCTKVAYTLNA